MMTMARPSPTDGIMVRAGRCQCHHKMKSERCNDFLSFRGDFLACPHTTIKGTFPSIYTIETAPLRFEIYEKTIVYLDFQIFICNFAAKTTKLWICL